MHRIWRHLRHPSVLDAPQFQLGKPMKKLEKQSTNIKRGKSSSVIVSELD